MLSSLRFLSFSDEHLQLFFFLFHFCSFLSVIFSYSSPFFSPLILFCSLLCMLYFSFSFIFSLLTSISLLFLEINFVILRAILFALFHTLRTASLFLFSDTLSLSLISDQHIHLYRQTHHHPCLSLSLSLSHHPVLSQNFHLLHSLPLSLTLPLDWIPFECTSHSL